jgi:hypothetical protein
MLDQSHTASRRGSMPPSMLNGEEGSQITQRESSERDRDRAEHSDPTKRVRVKRSNPTIRERTPLLPKGTHTINFGEELANANTPLPMMFVRMRKAIRLGYMQY